jgi:hypothetical protein
MPNRRSSSAAFTVYAAMPRGYYAPQAWLQPQKARDIASRNLTEFEISAEASGAMGINGAGSTTITVTTTADGQLIAQGEGSATITISASGTLAAVLWGEGSSSFSVTTSAVKQALAWGEGATDIEIDAAFQSYATGKIEGVIYLAGDPIVDVEYGGAVYVATWGVDSTVYPAGTATHPVKTLACANTVASKYNLNTYYLNGSHTFSRNHSNEIFKGWGALANCTVTLDEDYTLENVRFEDLIILGKMNAIFPAFGFSANLGTIQFDTCYIYAVEDLAGNFRDCQFAGNIKLKAGKWISATNSVIEGDTTYFDLRSTTGTTLSMDISSGWLQLLNSVDGCLTELNVKGGEVSFDSSNTGGEYYLEGVGTFFDESTGMTCKENHFIWDEPTSYHQKAGSTGKALTSAGSAGDPWSTAIPGAYTGNQAGKILDKINKVTSDTQAMI